MAFSSTHWHCGDIECSASVDYWIHILPLMTKYYIVSIMPELETISDEMKYKYKWYYPSEAFHIFIIAYLNHRVLWKYFDINIIHTDTGMLIIWMQWYKCCFGASSNKLSRQNGFHVFSVCSKSLLHYSICSQIP